MSRGKVGFLASLTLLGLSSILLWVSPVAAQTVSEPAGGTDELAPVAPEVISTSVNEDAPSVMIVFQRSADDFERPSPTGTDFTSGGTFSNTNDVAKYVVRRERGVGGAAVDFDVENSASNTLIFVDTNVENGATYIYTVIALDASNNEGAAAPRTVLIPLGVAPPAMIATLRSSVAFPVVTLEWDASSSEQDGTVAHYNVWSGGYYIAAVKIGTVTADGSASYTFTDEPGEGSIQYSVTAVTVLDNQEELESPRVGRFMVVRAPPLQPVRALQLSVDHNTQNANFDVEVSFKSSLDDPGRVASYNIRILELLSAPVVGETVQASPFLIGPEPVVSQTLTADGSGTYSFETNLSEDFDGLPIAVHVVAVDADARESFLRTRSDTPVIPPSVTASMSIANNLTPVECEDVLTTSRASLTNGFRSQLFSSISHPVHLIVVDVECGASFDYDFELLQDEENPEAPTPQESFLALQQEVEEQPEVFAQELTAEIAAEDPDLVVELSAPVVGEIVQASADLGSSLKGEELSATRTVTNQLEATDTITIAVEGAGFSVSVTELTLDAGAEGSFDIRFTGDANGDFEGQVSVTTGDLANPGETITATATVLADPPIFGLDTDLIDFGTATVGDPASTATLTVSNDGEADLEVTFEVSVGGDIFSLADVTVAGGESSDVEVSFAPLADGPVTGFVVANSNDEAEPFLVVQLDGVGVVPQANIILSADAIDFGDVEVDDSATETVTISNTGLVDLVGTLQVSGSDAFALVSVGDFTVPSDGELDVEVSFTPDAEGSFGGTLRIDSNDDEDPIVLVDLAGAGFIPTPEIDLVGVALNFGGVPIGVTATQTATIRNVGDADLEGTISLSGDMTFSTSAEGFFTLLAGENLAVDVTFAPTEEATSSGTITITSNDDDEPELTIALSGSGRTAGEVCIDEGGNIIVGDFDGNGTVNFTDFFRFADHFSTTPSSDNWDPVYDFDGNETVNFQDFFRFADDFGADCTYVTLGGEETTIDITNLILTATSTNCADYANSYISSVRDVNRDIGFNATLTITVTDNHCVISSNAIPNHDFNDGLGSFVNSTSTQAISYNIPRAPAIRSDPIALSLRVDNAIFLNGVKLDLLAAGCFGIGNGKIGCFEMDKPFRYDPMSELADFGTDTHNAHTQPDGTYHYHGNPNALFDVSASSSPVIGFAADGFPIYGSYFSDGGTVRKATSSYQLKSGARAAIDGTDPGDTYDGTFVDDYEYVAGAGDLDECNGMTVDGAYGYYVTDAYPWVLGCFRGTPDESFTKEAP